MLDEPMFCPIHGTPMQDIGSSLAERRLVCPRCLDANLAAANDKLAGANDKAIRYLCDYQLTEIKVQQILGTALGYPSYADDQVNFPGSTKADGVCVGGHVAESLACEAATSLAGLADALEKIVALTAGAEDLLAVHGWTAVAGRKLLQVRTAATGALERTPCPVEKA